MKKYITLIILCLFLPNLIIAKEIRIEGTVKSKTDKALQYVSIGIVNTSIGTVSDKNGLFTLIINDNLISENDSLRFSMIGYCPTSVSISEIKNRNNLNIQLSEKIEKIPEAIVIGKKIKTKVKGTKHQAVPLYTQLAISEYPNQNLGSALGRSFSINHENTLLENLRFYVYSNYDTVIFRINIYSMKRRKPSKSLVQTSIYKQITGITKDWIQVDLKKYGILVSNDLIVSIEWVDKSEKGDKLLFPLARPSFASHYYKYGSQNKWKKYRAMSTLMELSLKY